MHSRRQMALVLFISTNDAKKTKVWMSESLLVLNSDQNICWEDIAPAKLVGCWWSNLSVARQSGTFSWASSWASQQWSRPAWMPEGGIPLGWAFVKHCSASGSTCCPFWKRTQWFQSPGERKAAEEVAWESNVLPGTQRYFHRRFKFKKQAGTA